MNALLFIQALQLAGAHLQAGEYEDARRYLLSAGGYLEGVYETDDLGGLPQESLTQAQCSMFLLATGIGAGPDGDCIPNVTGALELLMTARPDVGEGTEDASTPG